MTSSRIFVIAFILLMIGVVVGLRFYFDEEGAQSKLSDVPCVGLLPTVFELQGERLAVSDEQTCELMRLIATMQPTGEKHHNVPDDPWHYYGRLRILPKNDAWLLVFNARGSSGFRPEFALQHRKGAGWTVVGQFNAAPVLRMLGVRRQLDMEKLQSPESLTPTDHTQPME